MFKDITIGQYFPGETLVHKYDPKLKMLTMILFIASLFFISSVFMYLPVVIYLLLIIYAAKLPMGLVLRGLKPLKWIILVTFIINLFFSPGEAKYTFGILKISQEGIDLAVFMGIRLILLVLGTSLLTYTTSPIELTDGIESLLRPFRKIGVPSHEIAMMMTIALRFIPTLIEETDKIMKAQMARGADFESGNIIKRAKNLVPLLVPLFINALKIAGELAVAMEARCYRGGEGRTRLNELSYQKRDFIAYAVIILLFILIIVSRII